MYRMMRCILGNSSLSKSKLHQLEVRKSLFHDAVTNILKSRIGEMAQMAKRKFVETVYQSDNYIAIDKEYDILVNSNDKNEVTVETQLNATYPELQDTTLKHSFRFSHRLDYPTSGVLCLSLNKQAAKHLHKAFADRKVVKHYLALVRGYTDFDERVIDQALGTDVSETFNKMCTTSSPHCTNPRPAVTKVVKLETGRYEGQPATKLLLLPQTGRTHQLRVHCVHMGHPIIGDYTYSNRSDTAPFRMMLHAYRLITQAGLEDLDICALDPFLPGIDELWQPDHVSRTYNEYMSDLQTRSTDSCAKVNICETESPRTEKPTQDQCSGHR